MAKVIPFLSPSRLGQPLQRVLRYGAMPIKDLQATISSRLPPPSSSTTTAALLPNHLSNRARADKCHMLFLPFSQTSPESTCPFRDWRTRMGTDRMVMVIVLIVHIRLFGRTRTREIRAGRARAGRWTGSARTFVIFDFDFQIAAMRCRAGCFGTRMSFVVAVVAHKAGGLIRIVGR